MGKTDLVIVKLHGKDGQTHTLRLLSRDIPNNCLIRYADKYFIVQRNNGQWAEYQVIDEVLAPIVHGEESGS